MGAWGHRIFQNDSALDWLGQAHEQGIIDAADAALRAALERAYLDVDEGSSAVAAAALVAAAADGDVADLPDVARELAAGSPAISRLRVVAIDALDLVLGPSSELASLWGAGAAGQPWRETVHDLQRRLRKQVP